MLKRYLSDDTGGTAVLSGVLSVLGIGAAALVVDFGQLTVLKTQMQNYADAAALAGAVHLDRTPNARARAEDVARNAAVRHSGISDDQSEIVVDSVTFYSECCETVTAATSDEDAHFIEVRLAPRRVNYLFLPIMRAFVGETVSGNEHGMVPASAVAQSDPFICHAPPLMLCDPAEQDPSLSLNDPANVGRQFRLKQPQSGGGAWAPGNFGLLQTPEGESGAAPIREALEAVSPTGCYTLTVDTATGSKTNQIRDGINARFDVGAGGPPAPDVINYYRDDNIVADPDEYFGSGNWDANQYWMDKHGAALPADLADATRYQVYLYELGVEFARDDNLTIYPVPPEGAPAGYTTITPPGEDIPVAADPANEDDPDFDGEPSTTPASNGAARRLVQVAVIQCVAENVHGSGTYPTTGNFAEFFITEHVKDPPDAAIYGEFVRNLTPSTSPQFHANVRLVR